MKPRLLPNLAWNAPHRYQPALLSKMTVTIQQAPLKEFSKRNFSSNPKNERSESQQPRVQGAPENEASYVLVLLTDALHQNSMNSLRTTYFPAKLNKIPAHLTLFHALPESKLEKEVIPAIKEIVDHTSPYHIKATRPFQLARGIGIAVADDIDFPKDGKNSRNTTSSIHTQLQELWKDWLSDQDSARLKLHYTVMNKVGDEKTKHRAFQELKESFEKGEDLSGGVFRYGDGTDKDHKDTQGNGKVEKWQPLGKVLGLILYKYEHTGHWVHPSKFEFR